MSAAGQSGWANWSQDGTFRDADFDEVVKAVVDDVMRVVDGYKEVSGRYQYVVGRWYDRGSAYPINILNIVVLR